jgi:bifunctional non-homologous end joining protein LigD
MESVDLYFREGNSDKIYRVYILEENNGYMVGFTYGRRGGHMTEGFKNIEPVSLDIAKKEFDKLVLSKMKKGYIKG